MHLIRYVLISTLVLYNLSGLTAQPDTKTARPWAYWWWPGSAVNKNDISQQLAAFRDVGLGGVHIIPIYGVKGVEPEFINFWSSEWLSMFSFVIEEAGRQNLGVDMTLGTGWPFGGPQIGTSQAARHLQWTEIQLSGDSVFFLDILKLLSERNWTGMAGVYALAEGKALHNLSDSARNNIIAATLPHQTTSILLFGVELTNQYVKRAAPGGEGLVVDYFSKTAMENYLTHFGPAFDTLQHTRLPRALYHDSYEVFGADWTDSFPDHFLSLRGYDMRPLLPILYSKEHPLRPALVCDIRETLSDLLYRHFATTWNNWSHAHHMLTRQQAHGSPANILDLYALADIPETESFGCSNFDIPGLTCDADYEEERFGRPSPLMMKFASSPAHIGGKSLVSAETGTWLANHFKVSLARLKPQIDELFVAGINHVFYHGITYSPVNEPFPGWLFYASTNFGLHSHFWEELPLLNSYVFECQSILQESQPDNDLLIYFPIHDLWTKHPDPLLLPLDVHKYSRWFGQTTFGETAAYLFERGFTFDYLSDLQLKTLKTDSCGKVFTGHGARYAAIIVPQTDFISRESFLVLDSLVSEGATVLFIDRFPGAFAGLRYTDSGPAEVARISQNLNKYKHSCPFDSLEDWLLQHDVGKETMKEKGLDFIRKTNDTGTVYFVTNLGNRFYEDSVQLTAKASYAKVIDPQNNTQTIHRMPSFAQGSRIHLRLPPGKSCIIQTMDTTADTRLWSISQPVDTVEMQGPWQVHFVSGDTTGLKSWYFRDSLTSWTTWGDEALTSFCGKAQYTVSFSMPKSAKTNETYLLVFDDIRETASVTLNGTPCGTIWARPFELYLPSEALQKGTNTLEIVVQNLSANHIAHIDRQQMNWKKFYDINFVDIRYTPFDASAWPPLPSGILGKVQIVRSH